QRLVRRLCRRCAVRHDNADYWGREIAKTNPAVGSIGKPLIQQAKGCADCGQTGFTGRTTIAELLLVDRELQRLVATTASDGDLETAACRSGMRTMYEIGIAKVWGGETTIEEVLRATRMT